MATRALVCSWANTVVAAPVELSSFAVALIVYGMFFSALQLAAEYIVQNQLLVVAGAAASLLTVLGVVAIGNAKAAIFGESNVAGWLECAYERRACGACGVCLTRSVACDACDADGRLGFCCAVVASLLLALFAAGMIHRVCVTVCFLCSMGLAYVLSRRAVSA